MSRRILGLLLAAAAIPCLAGTARADSMVTALRTLQAINQRRDAGTGTGNAIATARRASVMMSLPSEGFDDERAGFQFEAKAPHCGVDPSVDCVGFGGDWSSTRTLRRFGSLSIVARGWGMSYRDSSLRVSQAILTAGVRRQMADGTWVQAGVGVAQGEVQHDPAAGLRDQESEPVPAGAVAIGMTLIERADFKVDLSGRATAGMFRDEMSIYNVFAGFAGSWL